MAAPESVLKSSMASASRIGGLLALVSLKHEVGLVYLRISEVSYAEAKGAKVYCFKVASEKIIAAFVSFLRTLSCNVIIIRFRLRFEHPLNRLVEFGLGAFWQNGHNTKNTMKRIAIEKATKRLNEAIYHLEMARENAESHTFEGHWSRFLTALSSIPEIIFTGSKGDPISQQWYGTTKRPTVRTDPLTQYLLQARGADFHGISNVAAMQGEILGKGPSPLDISVTFEDMAGNTTVISTKIGDPVMIAGAFSQTLLPVTDHRGNIFQPPTIHLGNPIADQTPYGIGLIGIQYFRCLIEEATAFVR